MHLSTLNLAQPRNAEVLRYLKRANRDAPDIAAHDSLPNPYYQCGYHPDIVDIQNELGGDWVFGAWLPDELPWCKNVYAIFDLGAAPLQN